MALRSAEEHYVRQQRLLAMALAVVRRAFRLGDNGRAVPMLSVIQREAARGGALSVRQMLAEQRIVIPAQGAVRPEAFAGRAADGRSLLRLVVQADDDLAALERMARTEVADAARGAASVEIAARVGLGWTRMVNPPCCADCAILAGAYYKWNDGFERHPNCDCRHIPTVEDAAGDVRTNPDALFRNGHITNLTQAETKAIKAGADMTAVVNSRRSQRVDIAGRRTNSARTGTRPTVYQIFKDAGDNQDEAIGLLKRHGYLTS